MRFMISFLILVNFARCETYLTEAQVCSNDEPLTNVTKVISTVVSGPTGIGGYYYEEWTNSPSGNNTVSLYDKDATFRADWDDPDDFLGRVGLRWPEHAGKEYKDYGNIVAEYAYNRSGQGTAGARYNFIGIYGWAYDNDAKGIPLVEYYIIDDWFGNDEKSENDPIPESTACHDSDPGWVCQKGNFSVDGAEYKIYTNWRVNKPSIVGDTTFLQYFSIRQQYRKCGKITISEHFKKWESLGLRLGNLFEASLLVEVQKGTGFIDFTHARVLTNVPNSDLGITPGVYARACVDRPLHSDGTCKDDNDKDDAPSCYVQPDNVKCGPECPIDYEPEAGKYGKCKLKTPTVQQCLERPVQRSGCKNGTYGDAPCAQFGCGPSCYLNVRHTKCSLACDTGEVAAATGKYCDLAECSSRIPHIVAHSSSSHSVSNAVANYDVVISVKDVLFNFGYKNEPTVSFTVDGITNTTAALVGNDKIWTINEVFTWTGITPDKLTSVSVSINNIYGLVGGGTIDISDIAYKVSNGIDDTFKFFDANPNAQYSSTFALNYKVSVVDPSSNWPCGLPTATESPSCYLEGGKCVAEVIPDDSSSFTHAARWGGWALCLLIVVLIL